MIDALASSAHYVDHLAAVLTALPPEARGRFVTTNPSTAERAAHYGFETTRDAEGPQPVLVAAYGDLIRARSAGRARIAIMEHGAGQSYGGRHLAARSGSYAGGMNRGAASLFLHPGNHPAERERRAYPDARVEVVGSPHLDTLPAREGSGRTIAVSFHFNGSMAPETRTAWPWIFPSIARLKDRYDIIGHAHPRMFERAERLYRKHGIEPVAEFSEVCRRADLYVCDNSSTLFAFAATGRPVVVLNPPWYDRRVEHGLRFWEASGVGVNCNDPATLAACIDEALEDDPEQQAQREAALDLVYAYRSGAGPRAADVLMDWAA